MQSMKEAAANIAASAKAGMEKTKATVQEKMERMSAHDPMQKEVATERKEERMAQADMHKQEAREHNAASRQAASATGGQGRYTTGGDYGTGGTGDYGTTGTDAYGSTGLGGGYGSTGPGGGFGSTDTYGTTGTGSYGRTGPGGTHGSEANTYSTSGDPGFPMGTHQLSTMHGHGTGPPHSGQVDEGVMRTHPTGMPGETTGHNTRVEGTDYGSGPRGNAPGHGTGGSY